jgi:hypothetical protein
MSLTGLMLSVSFSMTSFLLNAIATDPIFLGVDDLDLAAKVISFERGDGFFVKAPGAGVAAAVTDLGKMSAAEVGFSEVLGASSSPSGLAPNV